MPALREEGGIATPQLDSLVPRDAHPAAMAYAARDAIALDASTPVKRQAISLPQGSIIPTYYNFDGPSAGTVVGIVLGSVLGFLLIVWLLWSLANINNPGGGTSIRGEEEIVVRRPRKRAPPPPRARSIIVEESRRVPGDDVVEVIEEHEEDYRSRRGSRRSGGGGYRY
ncbi:hypothetical protein K491DRAFT_104808 [Lophiostoma macrostomum CBS 122681]|uniref:Uncharacterized protein n=1 Tax=Lophiostoma macrostomum CBS 122681 TaxID=1314788 RepID=A0A6A6SVN1_9PLEO|nr:hypothetical protein K491DRAFT_104808 [Lophiostoma macrostomum CBS 122681]